MLPDASREAKEPPPEAVRPSALPYAKAFVVQFGAETDRNLGNATGRLEHLQTGRRSRFTSVDELLAQIRASLIDVEVTHTTGPPPHDGAFTGPRGRRPRPLTRSRPVASAAGAPPVSGRAGGPAEPPG
jgi:hypothetical protein